MQKIITKIEGEALLNIKGDEVIEEVDIEFYQFRGIENYLKNRHFLDALVINPRICGICGHSHLIATAKAIEDAFETKIPQKATLIRQLTLNLEIIQNHIKWFYITLFPTNISDKLYMFKAFELSNMIAKAIAVIAGQYPHTSYAIVGGITCDIMQTDLYKVQNILLEVLNKQTLFDDMELFFTNIPRDIGKSINRFLKADEIDINKIYEKRNQKNQFVTYNDQFYEVGPLARNKDKILEIYNRYGDSIYTRIYARIFEAIELLKYSIALVDEIDLLQENYIKPTIKSSKGYSIIEAPRGVLIHEVEIINEKIANYNIIVPTQFNLSSSKDMMSAAQQALKGEDKRYIDIIFKCFDVCAVCVGH